MRKQIDKIKNWKQFLNEGIFTKKTKLEELNYLMNKLELAYEKMIVEAGGEENLSNGVKLDYDNFGDFVDISYNIVDIIKNELHDINIKKQEDKIEDVYKYKYILIQLQNKTNTINYVRGVSEISVEQFKFVKRNIIKMLNSL